jgi:branched-subunit amino acid aminotransferase/4-amino-4-deoxychorismate lyase
LVFVKNGKIFSPKKNCYFGNTLKFISKKIKINFKDIFIKSIDDYDEIILIGSGKGVTSVSKIKELKWKRKNLKMYNRLNNIYKKLN